MVEWVGLGWEGQWGLKGDSSNTFSDKDKFKNKYKNINLVLFSNQAYT